MAAIHTAEPGHSAIAALDGGNRQAWASLHHNGYGGPLGPIV